MTGERDLAVLLASMEPVVIPGEFVFCCLAVGTAAPSRATIVEPEGVTHVLQRSDADRLGHRYDFVAGWIMLTIHSALDAVGLTAAVSAALTAEGISCNVIAGFHHDHLLVPIDRLDDAMTALRSLSDDASKR